MTEHVFALIGAVCGGLVVGALLAIGYNSWTFPTKHNSELPGWKGPRA